MPRTSTKPIEVPPTIAIALSGDVARPAGARALSTEGGSTPSQRFTKDIIRAGTYRHPRQGWTLSVDHARMDRWCETFGRMRDNGVDVEIFADHGKPSQRADKVRGYVADMFREGDTLNVVAEMVGEDGIKLARTVKNVSVEIDDFTDGQGNEYPDAIHAIAIVEKPVVPGQQPFRIAASLMDGEKKPRNLPVFMLSDPGEPGGEEPGGDSGDDSNSRGGRKRNNEDEDVPMDLIKRVAEITGKTCSSEAEAIAALNEWAKGASNPTAIAASICESVDEDVLEDTVTNREAELNELVSSGRITPAVKDKLHASLIGKSGERRILSLSTKANKGVPGVPKTSDVLAALKELPAKSNGERTGGQHLSLSRETPGGDEGNDDEMLKASRERAERRNPSGIRKAS